MLEQFIELAMELGVLVVFAEIGSLYGLLRNDGVVVLNWSDPEEVQRVALCHECGHWVLGHIRVSSTDPRHRRQEDQADEYAARLLIDPAAYQAAETHVGSEPSVLARELAVPVRIIRAWRRAERCRPEVLCSPAASIASRAVRARPECFSL